MERRIRECKNIVLKEMSFEPRLKNRPGWTGVESACRRGTRDPSYYTAMKGNEIWMSQMARIATGKSSEKGRLLSLVRRQGGKFLMVWLGF